MTNRADLASGSVSAPAPRSNLQDDIVGLG